MTVSKKRIYSFIALCSCLLLLSNNLLSQSLNELKLKKEKIENEILTINSLIDKTEDETKTSLSTLKLTKRKIELKNQLINQIAEEERIIQLQIDYRKTNIDSLRNITNNIKEEYKRLIVYSSKNKNRVNILLMIFTSNDFNQAYKRIKFYQQLLEYKELQVTKYRLTIEKLRSESDNLNENISQLTKKQKEKLNELNILKEVQTNFKTKVAKLGKKRTELYAELEKQKKISNNINAEIKRIIEEEAKKAREETNNSKRKDLSNLSANFKENIGKFILPVKDGVITGSYGESFHPVLKEIKVKNNGIDITISSKSDVFTVFKGEVRKIFKVPGSNLAIIIRHGNFLTVYSNLSIVSVSAGQEIKTYQKIGEINLPKGERSNVLHFELWNENKTEDPLKWIRTN